MTQEKDENLNLSFFLIVGFILIIGLICVIFWVASLRQNYNTATASQSLFAQPRQGELIRLTPVSAGEDDSDGETASTVSDSEGAAAGGVIAAVEKGGCVACHVIPGVPDAVGQIGPDLSTIGLAAADRIEGYSAEQYIRESLLEPNAFTAPACPMGECPAGTMPQLQLTDPEIETLVTYLLTLGKE